MADTTNVTHDAVEAAKHAYDATYKLVFDKTNDARVATEKAGQVAAEYLKGPGIATNLVGAGVSFLAELLAVGMDKITQVKKAGQPGLHDLIAATLSDALLIEVNGSDIPTGTDVKGQFRVNAALGGRFLDVLKQFMGADDSITGDTAEKAVAAFMGFGMQLAVNTGLLAMIGGAVPFEHFNELKEIGEMLEKSLGLGRLTRQFMAPYLRVLVQKPLEHKLNAKYRQDILGTHELVKAIFRQSPIAGNARTLLAQHGLPEDQIDELVDQLRPHLTESELDTLVFHAEISQPGAEAHIQAAGVPPSVAQLRFRALTLKRLEGLQNAAVNHVLSLIQDGKLPTSELDAALVSFDIPQIEWPIWKARIKVIPKVRRKLLSHGDMLFLFEGGQVTLEEVRQWAVDEGYSSQDQERLLLLFELKATAAIKTKSGGAAVKAGHIHKEHIAFVTDQITGLWGRAPEKAELDYWVNLLDLGERTKADFRTELKALDPSGPAMPAHPPA